jgi:Icc-related predicted phosphoesterase
MERGVAWLRERVQDRPVIYIAGNHEAYRCDIDRTRKKAKEAAVGGNVIVLENECVVLNGVRFVAGTLWTDFRLFDDPEVAMRVAGQQMNDYRLIRIQAYARRLRPLDTLARHVATRAFIERVLAESFAGPTVVVTHHGPHRGALKSGQEYDVVSAAYVSDLTPLIRKYQPQLWIYGHTHRSDDTIIGRTRIVSNAKGYGPRLAGGHWENPCFAPKLTIEV